MSSSGNPESGLPAGDTWNSTAKTPNPSLVSPSSSMNTRDFASVAQNSDDGNNSNNINNNTSANNINSNNDNTTTRDESATAANVTESEVEKAKSGETSGESVTVHASNTSSDKDKVQDKDRDTLTDNPQAENEHQSEASLKEDEEDSGVSLSVTLLLTSGARHPLIIDGKYLRKHSTKVPRYDPFEMSVYTLKELIWKEWRPDWDARPSSPSLIRLISFGKLLDDKVLLSDCKFNHDAPNVVHMTVKPQEALDEDDGKVAKDHTSHRETRRRSPRCRCVIL